MTSPNPQQLVATLEATTGGISGLQNAVNLSGVNVDVAGTLTSGFSNILDSKNMASLNLTVPEGVVEKAETTIQNLVYFAGLSDNDIKILMAKMIQLGKKNEAMGLQMLLIGMKMSDFEFITPQINSDITIQVEKPAES